ncbi:MAG: choice-of-anchor D domain-containing protein, partial [Luteolibacter sp.]
VALVSSSASNVTSVQACLTSLGATTQFLDYYSLTQASLELFDVAVFDSNIDYVNSTQVTAISSWLAGGGALLVHSSGSSYSNQNKLFTPFGISLSYQYHTGAWTPVGTHYLTKGITSVSPSYSSSRITPSGPAVPLLRETGGNVTAAISQVNQGRLAVLAGAISSFTGDNQLFFGRMVGWLGNHVEWLSQSPKSGTLAANATTANQANFDARELFAGTYTANLLVESVSLANPLVVPVRMTVTGTPDIAVPSPVVQFPQTHVGYAKQSSLSISNEGTAPLLIQSVSLPNPDLTVITGLPAVIGPHESLALVTEFRPTSSLQLAGSIQITSNDPDTPLISLPVTGNSIFPPVAIAPASLQMTAVSGQTATKSITIGNPGGSDLSWSLEFGSPATSTPLEEVLPLLDESAETITALIPGKYSFTDGITGNSISDGGSDMYDNGNYLSSNL